MKKDKGCSTAKKITIVGFFAYNTEHNEGQENKTRALAFSLEKRIGKKSIYIVDTFNWKKRPIRLLHNLIKSVRRSDVVIMLPARNGLKIFAKLLPIIKKDDTKLFYSVIGGWLSVVTASNRNIKDSLARFDGIWVETNSMKKELAKQGLSNVLVVPNFKIIKPISVKNLLSDHAAPFKICTFSRVMKEKGIEDAIDVVKRINEKYGRTVYELDIYGRVDKNYEEIFENIKKTLPDYIKYMGVAPYDDTPNIIKNYFFLLFPTRYSTEGIPGTIIDAYAAGVPVVSARWNSYDDVVVDNVTGVGFRQNNIEDLEKKLIEIIENPTIIIEKKEDCLKEFKKYSEEYAFDIIKREIL